MNVFVFQFSSKRAITDIQAVEVINVMLLAASSYAMVIVPYNDEELQEIQSLIEKALLKRLRILEKKGWTDWMTLHRDNGGLGLNAIRDLYQAQQTNGLLLTLNGPDCAAKRSLITQMMEDMNSNQEVNADSPLYAVIHALKSRNATLHSKYQYVNETYLHELIKNNQALKDAKRTFCKDKKNDVGFWINALFIKSTRWDARDGQEMRTRLNTFNQDRDILLSQKHFENFSTALHQEYQTHTTDDNWQETIQKLKEAHDEIFPVIRETADDIWRKRVNTWRPRPRDEIIRTLNPINEGEVHLYELDEAAGKLIDRLFAAITEATKPINLLPRDKTSIMRDTPTRPSNRLAVITFERENWEVTYTDGSQTNLDGTSRAGWATFRPQSQNSYKDHNAGEDGRQRASARVDGPQINSRAELSAILAALISAEGRMNQLIVTDSKSSIDLLDTWRTNKLSNRQKRKTPNRDLVKSILEAEKKITGKVKYYHIYSHQQDATEERKGKIDNQKNELSYEDRPLYDTFRKGNEEADRLAGTKTVPNSGTGKQRDWTKEPIRHVDDFYIVRNDTLEDRPPHKWMKETTQTSILQKEHTAKQRCKYLKHFRIIDKKRSFAAGDRANHKGHRTYTALFKLRMHAAPTAKKTARRAGHQDANSPYKQFFSHLYPDDKCYACGLKHIAVVEDTKHMMECPSRDDRKTASLQLWHKIHSKIKSKQKPNSAKNVAWLRPFALRTQEALGLHHVGAGHRLSAALAEVAAFPDEAAQLGLIPRTLEGALRELDVENPKKLADKIARLCQEAVAADLYARHQAIATGRDQKALFATHVLGRQNV